MNHAGLVIGGVFAAFCLALIGVGFVGHWICC